MRSCAQTRTFRSRATSMGDLWSTRPSVESGARVGDDLHLMSSLFRRDGSSRAPSLRSLVSLNCGAPYKAAAASTPGGGGSGPGAETQYSNISGGTDRPLVLSRGDMCKAVLDLAALSGDASVE